MKSLKNALVSLALAVVATWYPLAALAQSVPMVTPVAGVCGQQANTCSAGTLGAHAIQPDGSYQWFCNSTSGGSTSRLCFSNPLPAAMPMLGNWMVTIYNGTFRDGHTSLSRPMQPSATAIVLDQGTTGVGDGDSAHYQGYLPAYPGSNVYLNIGNLNGPMPSAHLHLVFQETSFAHGDVHYEVNVDLNVPNDQFGFGTLQGKVFPRTGPMVRSGFIAEADFYRPSPDGKGGDTKQLKLRLSR